MKTLRASAAAMLIAAGMTASAHAATRIYLMRGLGGLLLSDAMDQIGARLHGRGRTIGVGDWSDAAAFERDALGHPHDRIVLIGHSMGAKAAGDVGTDLKRRGYSVKVIGIDPLFTGASCGPGVDCICFWGQGFEMRGAKNVHIPSSYGHIGYAADPRVRARVIAAVPR
jgi:pimeloyl-ACP methyl ester carboxylesterase